MVKVILNNQTPGNTDWWTSEDGWNAAGIEAGGKCTGAATAAPDKNRCGDGLQPWYFEAGQKHGLYWNWANWYCLDPSKVECKKLTNSQFPGKSIVDSWTIKGCNQTWSTYGEEPTGKCSYDPPIDHLTEDQRGDYAKLVIDNWDNVIEGGTTVMKNYCLGEVSSENCPGGNTCPRMVSGIGNSVNLCNNWYDKDTTNASNEYTAYCKDGNQKKPWCNCISGDDPKNDLHPIFDAVSRIPGTDANQRQCWFQPCKDGRTQMLIPKEYNQQGLKCTLPKCANINIQVADRGGTIDNAGLSSNISCSDSSGNPSSPEIPDTPGTPDAPGTSGTPGTPDAPGTPDVPGIPDNMPIYIIILILILLGLVVAFVG